jgi:DNA-binding transcriptional regulator YhcF (GntR family)
MISYMYSTKALQRARHHLNQALSNHRWNFGDKLPTLRVLALEAGVAPLAYGKALTEKVELGILCIQKRQGIFLGEIPSTAITPINPSTKWKRITDTIRTDFLSGIFPPGSKRPTLAEWRIRYQVGFKALSHALRQLEKEGWLLADGTYADPRTLVGQKPGGLKILVIGSLCYIKLIMRWENWFRNI